MWVDEKQDVSKAALVIAKIYLRVEKLRVTCYEDGECDAPTLNKFFSDVDDLFEKLQRTTAIVGERVERAIDELRREANSVPSDSGRR